MPLATSAAGNILPQFISTHALQVFDKDDIGLDADTAVARVELSNETLLALRSVGCNVNGMVLTSLSRSAPVLPTCIRISVLCGLIAASKPCSRM
jgi:hypothetical protein